MELAHVDQTVIVRIVFVEVKMFKRIVKRDGKIVKFDPEKIIEAIA